VREEEAATGEDHGPHGEADVVEAAVVLAEGGGDDWRGEDPFEQDGGKK